MLPLTISFFYGNIHALVCYCACMARYPGALEAGGRAPSLQELKDELRIEHILTG